MTEVKNNFGQMPGGWIPDTPDHRDLTRMDFPTPLGDALDGNFTLSSDLDLRRFFTFPEVDDQGQSKATSAFACGDLVEHCIRHCEGRLLPISKSFLYRVAQRLHGHDGGCGVSLRQVLKALTRVGAPPSRCLSHYEDPSLDPLLYTYAVEYHGMKYFRIDTPESDRLDCVRRLLSLGLPCVFGMPLPTSVSSEPEIDFRGRPDEFVGGTAGLFVGYDDSYRITSRGALLFRSTWGPGWGNSGYGWLSYRFLEKHLVRDIWTLFNAEWDNLPLQPALGDVRCEKLSESV